MKAFDEARQEARTIEKTMKSGSANPDNRTHDNNDTNNNNNDRNDNDSSGGNQNKDASNDNDKDDRYIYKSTDNTISGSNNNGNNNFGYEPAKGNGLSRDVVVIATFDNDDDVASSDDVTCSDSDAPLEPARYSDVKQHQITRKPLVDLTSESNGFGTTVTKRTIGDDVSRDHGSTVGSIHMDIDNRALVKDGIQHVDKESETNDNITSSTTRNYVRGGTGNSSSSNSSARDTTLDIYVSTQQTENGRDDQRQENETSSDSGSDGDSDVSGDFDSNQKREKAGSPSSKRTKDPSKRKGEGVERTKLEMPPTAKRRRVQLDLAFGTDRSSSTQKPVSSRSTSRLQSSPSSTFSSLTHAPLPLSARRKSITPSPPPILALFHSTPLPSFSLPEPEATPIPAPASSSTVPHQPFMSRLLTRSKPRASSLDSEPIHQYARELARQAEAEAEELDRQQRVTSRISPHFRQGLHEEPRKQKPWRTWRRSRSSSRHEATQPSRDATPHTDGPPLPRGSKESSEAGFPAGERTRKMPPFPLRVVVSGTSSNNESGDGDGIERDAGNAFSAVNDNDDDIDASTYGVNITNGKDTNNGNGHGYGRSYGNVRNDGDPNGAINDPANAFTTGPFILSKLDLSSGSVSSVDTDTNTNTDTDTHTHANTNTDIDVDFALDSAPNVSPSPDPVALASISPFFFSSSSSPSVVDRDNRSTFGTRFVSHKKRFQQPPSKTRSHPYAFSFSPSSFSSYPSSSSSLPLSSLPPLTSTPPASPPTTPPISPIPSPHSPSTSPLLPFLVHPDLDTQENDDGGYENNVAIEDDETIENALMKRLASECHALGEALRRSSCNSRASAFRWQVAAIASVASEWVLSLSWVAVAAASGSSGSLWHACLVSGAGLLALAASAGNQAVNGITADRATRYSESASAFIALADALVAIASNESLSSESKRFALTGIADSVSLAISFSSGDPDTWTRHALVASIHHQLGIHGTVENYMKDLIAKVTRCRADISLE